MSDAFVKGERIEGMVLYRLLLLARFMHETGEWGHLNTKSNIRGLQSAYRYAMNAGTMMRRHILPIYKAEAIRVIEEKMTKERIKDISLVLDELIDAENVEELHQLIKTHKKVNRNT